MGCAYGCVLAVVAYMGNKKEFQINQTKGSIEGLIKEGDQKTWLPKKKEKKNVIVTPEEKGDFQECIS